MVKSAFVGLALSAVFVQGVAAQPPRSGPSTHDDRNLLPYAGTYVIAPHHELVVALQKAPGFTAIVLYDLSTDAVRVLWPVSPDTFAAGTELARPQPIEFKVAFRRAPSGRVTEMNLSGRGWPANSVAVRRWFREEQVRFTRGDVALSGTVLTTSQSGQKRPAVVLVHGSEDADRYSFGALPYVLASHGFVTLMFDKRGTGSSTGSWSSVGLEPLAEDVRAGMSLLSRRSDVDPSRIGLVGLSEGGWTAPLAASYGPGAAFIVAISGGGLTKADAFIHKNRVRLQDSGLTGQALDSALAPSINTIAESRYRLRSGSSPSGFDRRVLYDPSEHWRAFRGPILSLGGEADALEDAVASAQRLRELLTQAKHRDFTIRVFPRAHHGGLFLGRTGRPAEWYGLQGITYVAPGFWDVFIRWLDVRYGRA